MTYRASMSAASDASVHGTSWNVHQLMSLPGIPRLVRIISRHRSASAAWNVCGSRPYKTRPKWRWSRRLRSVPAHSPSGVNTSGRASLSSGGHTRYAPKSSRCRTLRPRARENAVASHGTSSSCPGPCWPCWPGPCPGPRAGRATTTVHTSRQSASAAHVPVPPRKPCGSTDETRAPVASRDHCWLVSRTTAANVASVSAAVGVGGKALSAHTNTHAGPSWARHHICSNVQARAPTTGTGPHQHLRRAPPHCALSNQRLLGDLFLHGCRGCSGWGGVAGPSHEGAECRPTKQAA